MKKKITISVPSSGQKSCSKAMKIVFSLPGVESAALKGDGKAQIEIAGENVDPAELTAKLKRKMRQVDLVSVSEIKKEEKKDEKPTVDEEPEEVVFQSLDVWEPRRKLMYQVDPESEIRKEKIMMNKKPKDGSREPPYIWVDGQGPYGCYVGSEPTTRYQDNSWSMYRPIRQ